jgi:hypothetical protein
MKDTRTRPSACRTMGSAISNHLRQVSANLQRVPSKPNSPKDGYLNTATGKRRRLEMEIRSHPEDGSWDDAVPATSYEPSVSFTTTLGYGSDQSAQGLPNTDLFSKSATESHHAGCFRKEIRMELLEIVDKLDEIDELYSLTDAEFATRCTLEIFIATHEDTTDGIKLKCGEGLWRDQQMGVIRTICDEFGNGTTHVMLPKPFLIPAEELFVKRPSNAVNSASGQSYRLDLGDQYVIKIWLEAPSLESPWPPMAIESNLDHNGRMVKWLRDGTFRSTDIRLMCKGVLFPEGGSYDSFDVVFKLGGLRMQTNYTLRLDIQYSLPPPVRTWLSTPNIQGHSEDSEITSPDLPFRTRSLPSSEADVVNVEDDKPAEKPSQKPPMAPPLAVPMTKQRLCDAVIKHVLKPAEELYVIDDDLETCWRTAKHMEMIRDRPDISINTKDYIIKWDLYVTPLRLSCNFYVPQALLRFVEENKAWFAEQPCRIKEFSFHATSLRLRGSIDMKCFADCVTLLQDCNRLNAASEETSHDAPVEDAAEDTALGETAKEEALNRVVVNEDEINEEARDIGAVDEEEANKEAWNEETMDEDGASKDVSDQDEVLGNAINKDTPGEIQRPTPKRDKSKESADGEATHEDANEQLQILAIDNYFDAEDGEDILQQPFYFHSYWQSITQRWPRLKLHGTYSFGVAVLLAAIAVFQGFPGDNIDRLIALYIHYCPNENIQDLTDMYHNAPEVLPEVQGVCMTERKLHRIMWEAGRQTCEGWLTDVYRLEDGSRGTVQDAIETSMNIDAWNELWEYIARNFKGRAGSKQI